MSRTISNSDDVIDSRDVIARIEELEEERDSYERSDDLETAGTWATDNPDGAEELKALKALADDGESLSDWTHGEALIRESYFEDHARELAEDMHGEAMRDAHWPFTCIDWERAARDLRMDYTSLDFDGVTYYARG